MKRIRDILKIFICQYLFVLTLIETKTCWKCNLKNFSLILLIGLNVNIF